MNPSLFRRRDARLLIAVLATGIVLLGSPMRASASADGPGTDPAVSSTELTASVEEATQGLDPRTAATVATAVEAVASTGATAVVPSDDTAEHADGSTSSDAGGIKVETPSSGKGEVEISAPGGSLSLDLPVPASSEAVVVGGVAVYPTATGAVTQHTTDNGATATSFVLNGPSAPTAYKVGVTVEDGGSLRLEDDGTVTILAADGSEHSSLAKPWAKDAEGNALPTRYTVDGNAVTQHVDITGVTAFPVVADPFWSTFGAYMRCILGIGVPAGVAIVFVTYVGFAGLKVIATNASVKYVPGRPPWVGTVVKWYARGVWNSCRQFVNS